MLATAQMLTSAQQIRHFVKVRVIYRARSATSKPGKGASRAGIAWQGTQLRRGLEESQSMRGAIGSRLIKIAENLQDDGRASYDDLCTGNVGSIISRKVQRGSCDSLASCRRPRGNGAIPLCSIRADPQLTARC